MTIRLMAYRLASVCGIGDYATEHDTTGAAACKERIAELGLKLSEPDDQ